MSFLYHLRVAFIGFCMGLADLVPGVSGGTIAFVGGIYDRLVNGLKTFDLPALRLLLRGQFRLLFASLPLPFFLALGFGLLTAIFSLSPLLASLFHTHPVALWSFFFGLIFGSLFLLARDTWRWQVRDWTLFTCFAIATFWLVGHHIFQTPPSLPYLFLSGVIAISAMILPGLSGSYLLVILGKYQQVLEILNTRDWASLAVFVSGIIVGVLSFVRLVAWLLNTHRRATLIALTGLMAGALRTVWPWKETLESRINSKGIEVPLLQINIAPPAGWAAVPPALLFAALGLIAVLGLTLLRPPAP